MPGNGSFEKMVDDVIKGAVGFVEERLKKEGGLFWGVSLVSNLGDDRQNISDRLILALNTKVRFLGGNRIRVRLKDLSNSNLFDVNEIQRQRTTYPNRVFLFYDPDGLLDKEGLGERLYRVDLERLVHYF